MSLQDSLSHGDKWQGMVLSHQFCQDREVLILVVVGVVPWADGLVHLPAALTCVLQWGLWAVECDTAWHSTTRHGARWHGLAELGACCAVRTVLLPSHCSKEKGMMMMMEPPAPWGQQDRMGDMEIPTYPYPAWQESVPSSAWPWCHCPQDIGSAWQKPLLSGSCGVRMQPCMGSVRGSLQNGDWN